MNGLKALVLKQVDDESGNEEKNGHIFNGKFIIK